MECKLVNYHACDFIEASWMERLLPQASFEYRHDPERKLVLPNSIVMCSRVGELRGELLERIARTPGMILFHISDEWYREDYSVYGCFTHVIRNHYHTGLVSDCVTAIPLGPYAYRLTAAPLGSITERRYVWCFAGQPVTTRRAMLRHMRQQEPYYAQVAGVKDYSGPRLSKTEYLRLLEDTMFVPCPMGNAHLESFRLYESLDCGCIPIVEKRPWLDYYTLLLGRHPLPTVTSWGQAPQIIQSLCQDPGKLRAKQQEIAAWWKEYENRLSQTLERVLINSSGQTRRVRIPWPGATRWRGFLELLKHHNGIALLARARLTCRRLSQRWTVARVKA